MHGRSRAPAVNAAIAGHRTQASAAHGLNDGSSFRDLYGGASPGAGAGAGDGDGAGASSARIDGPKAKFYCVPNTPASPELHAVGEDAIQIRWTPAYCAPRLPCQGYTVQMRIVGEEVWKYYDGSTGKLVDIDGEAVQAHLMQCIVKGLSAQVQYEAIVSARNAAGWSKSSKPSEPLSVDTSVPPTPDAPELAAAGENRIRVKWLQPECTLPCEGYAVQVRIVGQRAWKLYDASSRELVDAEGSVVEAPSTQCIVKGLSPLAKYEAIVAAKNAAGWSPASKASQPLSINTCVPPTLDAPELESIGEDQIRVKWIAQKSSLPSDSYTVKMRMLGEGIAAVSSLSTSSAVSRTTDSGWKSYDASSETLVEDGGEMIQAPVTECIVKGLNVQSKYEVIVSAKNLIGWSADSQASQIVLGLPNKPPPPKLYRLGATSFNVAWSASSSGPSVLEYRIRMRELGTDHEWRFYDSAAGKLVKREGTHVAAPATECTVKQLLSRAAYEAVIEYRGEMGWGPASDTINSQSRNRAAEHDPFQLVPSSTEVMQHRFQDKVASIFEWVRPSSIQNGNSSRSPGRRHSVDITRSSQMKPTDTVGKTSSPSSGRRHSVDIEPLPSFVFKAGQWSTSK